MEHTIKNFRRVIVNESTCSGCYFNQKRYTGIMCCFKQPGFSTIFKTLRATTGNCWPGPSTGKHFIFVKVEPVTMQFETISKLLDWLDANVRDEDEQRLYLRDALRNSRFHNVIKIRYRPPWK